MRHLKDLVQKRSVAALVLQPWGSDFIFNADVPAFKLWWACNPEAMAYLCTCWIEQSSVDPCAQVTMLSLAGAILEDLDWGELRAKKMFAAEVLRLESASSDQQVLKIVSDVLSDCPEMRLLWQRSNSIPDSLSLRSLPFGLKASQEVTPSSWLQCHSSSFACAMKSAW